MPPLSLTGLRAEGKHRYEETAQHLDCSSQEAVSNLPKAPTRSSSASSESASCSSESSPAEALPHLPALPSVGTSGRRVEAVGATEGTSEDVLQVRVDRIVGLIDKVQNCLELQQAAQLAF
eukprot:1696317-Amphidinium_carterae.1